MGHSGLLGHAGRPYTSDVRGVDVDKRQRMTAQLGILKDAGIRLPDNAVILDLGCGNGDLVAEYRRHGFDVYGCDFKFKAGRQVEKLRNIGAIRLIERDPYRMPFADQSFDVVVSDQVFEHVDNYPEVLAEHRRILKSGGVGLHFFPSRYRLVEPHVRVPCATILQGRNWLLFWALVGIRKPSQRGISAKERASDNYDYLRRHTNYLSKKQIIAYFGNAFERVEFREDLYFKYSVRVRFLHALSHWLPFVSAMYGTLKGRVVLCRKRSQGKLT
jgi:ubiquinone/menaquinone biosynthesis C-methylase UbiE